MVLDTIRNAEAVFIAGGDQATYLDLWQGTGVQSTLQTLAVDTATGGTSAGMAILGQFVYSASDGSVTSATVLADPFSPEVTLTREFLNVPALASAVTDTHFAQRDRMGQLVTFMARIAQDGWAVTPRGIGIDESTALLIEPDGQASVAGSGAVYLLRATRETAVCRSGQPLTYKGIATVRANDGDQFNLTTWSSNVTPYQLDVTAGKLTSSSGRVY